MYVSCFIRFQRHVTSIHVSINPSFNKCFWNTYHVPCSTVTEPPPAMCHGASVLVPSTSALLGAGLLSFVPYKLDASHCSLLCYGPGLKAGPSRHRGGLCSPAQRPGLNPMGPPLLSLLGQHPCLVGNTKGWAGQQGDGPGVWGLQVLGSRAVEDAAYLWSLPACPVFLFPPLCCVCSHPCCPRVTFLPEESWVSVCSSPIPLGSPASFLPSWLPFPKVGFLGASTSQLEYETFKCADCGYHLDAAGWEMRLGKRPNQEACV